MDGKTISELTPEECAAITATLTNVDQLEDSERRASEIFEGVRAMERDPIEDESDPVGLTLQLRDLWLRHSTQESLDGFVHRQLRGGDTATRVAGLIANHIRGWCAVARRVEGS